MLIYKLLRLLSGALLSPKASEVVRSQNNVFCVAVLHLQTLGSMRVHRKKTLLRLLFYIGCVCPNTLILHLPEEELLCCFGFLLVTLD